jgi:hypothetical protein
VSNVGTSSQVPYPLLKKPNNFIHECHIIIKAGIKNQFDMAAFLSFIWHNLVNGSGYLRLFYSIVIIDDTDLIENKDIRQ